jgi:hypothetical protein
MRETRIESACPLGLRARPDIACLTREPALAACGIAAFFGGDKLASSLAESGRLCKKPRLPR